MSRLYPHTLARLSYITATFQSSTIEIGGSYKIGPEIRPVIKHDSEFSNFPKQEPTLGDYVNLLKWVSMLEGAAVLRPDLADGVAAYRHFHDGEGKGKIFAYDRYILNDASGKITLRNAVLGTQDAAITLWENNGEPTEFSFTGPAIHCGANNPITPYNSRAFPYPATENWQSHSLREKTRG